MTIFKNLFKKKEKKVSTLKQFHVNNEDYNQVSSFIDNVNTMEDCKLANKMIDDLNMIEVYTLRNTLCDKTFEVFFNRDNEK
jgi:hypothetical protein